ncbi:hypothetical protein IMX07_07025 [bacterium]|nr:hypothetical protein [bacterium]
MGNADRNMFMTARQSDAPRSKLARARSASIAMLLAAAVAGCSLFHHGESPQQRFIDELNRGNAAQASQTWLNMSERDREALSHNQGFKPQLTQKEVEEAVERQAERRAEAGVTDPDSTGIDDSVTPDPENGDITTQMIEQPGVQADPNANGLSSLPKLTAPDQAPASLEESPQ